MIENKNILVIFGNKVREIRKTKNLSQEDLADKADLHRTYIGMIERGERNISLTNIAVFAMVFEMTISELLDFSSINPKHSYKNYEIKIEE